jgi:hypothetical protein
MYTQKFTCILISLWNSCCRLFLAMACEILVGYSTDNSEEVEVDGETSSCCSRIEGCSSTSHNETSLFGPVDRSAKSAFAYCQYLDEDTFIECLSCGSWFDPETYCPGC